MNLESYGNNAASRGLRVVILAMVYAVMVAASGMAAQQSKHVPETVVRERISTLIRETMAEGQHVVNGVKIWIWTRPSNEAVEEVRSYGEAAIPTLTEHLKSEEIHERELAMRFLGQIGGSQIVEPLRMVLLLDTSPGIRELALRWLTTAPWDLASPIIERSAAADVDQKVRDAAKEILASHARK
jgi:hypothetical protein